MRSSPPASRSGMLRIRLFQPFPAEQIDRRPAADGAGDRGPRPDEGAGRRRRAALPRASSRRLAEAMDGDEPPFATAPRVIGGRYGLSSKEMTPSMIKPIFDELAAGAARSGTSRSASTTT